MTDDSADVPDDRAPVAVVGSGTIGTSWAVLFAAHGHEVRVVDPREDLPSVLDGAVRRVRPDLVSMGFDDLDAIRGRITIASDIEEAVAAATFVQEAGPEQLDWKRRAFAAILDGAPAGTVVASSSSAIPVGTSAADLPGSDRVIVGHPFNPPHVMPLVEVVPGPSTAEETIATAMAFYASVGRHPVLLRREVPGFVANRLQAALVREAFHLVLDGVVTPAQVDEVVRDSLGVRWATSGPFLGLQLGGGTAGFTGIVTGIGRGLGPVWDDPVVPPLDDATVARLARAVAADYGATSDEDHDRTARAGELAVIDAVRAGRRASG